MATDKCNNCYHIVHNNKTSIDLHTAISLSGLSGALLGALTQNCTLLWGINFDNHFSIQSFVALIHVKTLCCNCGLRGAELAYDTLSLLYYEAFDIRACQIPTIAPYNPEDWGNMLIGALFFFIIHTS